MTELVPPDDIERIVGIRRQEVHFARAVSEERRVYILHSVECKETTPDLRDCRFSIALDHGIEESRWEGMFDMPVWVTVLNGRLVPVKKFLNF